MGAQFDLVKVTTATTGTGTVTLGSVVAGFRTFAGAGVADGVVVSYGIWDRTANTRETGNGTVGASGTTMTRVLSASSTGALLNLTGNTEVTITALSADFVAGGSSGQLQFNNAGAFAGSLLSQGTNTISQSNTTSPQTFEVFNNVATSDRGGIRWSGNQFQVGAFENGAVPGLYRSMRFGTDFTSVTCNGSNAILFGAGFGATNASVNNQGVLAAHIIGFCPDPNTATNINVNTRLMADAANTLAQRNGTAAQESRVYGTFTDASNYRRLAKGMSAAGVAFLRPEGAGTGASGNTLTLGGASILFDALALPLQRTNATEPSFVNGAVFFNTDLDKLRIGGASAWETVTSV